MPGVGMFTNLATRGNPQIQGSGFPLAANLDGSALAKPYMFFGDFVVQTTNSTYRGTNDPSVAPLYKNVRPLLQSDATALYGAGQVSAPSAPTATKVNTGGVLTSGQSFYFVVTLVSVTGETTASAVSAQTNTASNTDSIVITAPTVPANAVGYKVYMGLNGGANTGPFYLVSGTVGAGTNFIVQNASANTEPTPPTGNTTGGIAGILGVACWDAATNAYGINATAVVPKNVNPATVAVYPLAGVAASYPPFIDPANTSIVHSLEDVILATDSELFVIQLNPGGSGAHTFSGGLMGQKCGVVVTDSAAVPYSNTYYADTSLSGAAACLEIVRGLDTDPANTHVVVKVLSDYQQYKNGVPYSAE